MQRSAFVDPMLSFWIGTYLNLQVNSVDNRGLSQSLMFAFCDPKILSLLVPILIFVKCKIIKSWAKVKTRYHQFDGLSLSFLAEI